MPADVLVASGWRCGETLPVRTPRAHLTLLPCVEGSPAPVYRWRKGPEVVTLGRDAGAWVVRVTTTGRLFGPTKTVYEERHDDERYACWDVMARVIASTRDEDEGVQAGRDSASWIADTFERTTLAHP